MVYFWVQPKEKSNLVAYQTNYIPHVYSYNINLPHDHCNNLPHGDDFSIKKTHTCASKTLTHEPGLISPIILVGLVCLEYILGTHHFPIVSIFICILIILAEGESFAENVTNLLREIKTCFEAFFFLLPSIISKFRVDTLFEILFVRYKSELQFCFVFWKRYCNNLPL